MQLQQLKYFAAVIEHKSFSRAAKALFISQPSLSQAVQALEAELGFTLLVRTRAGSLPTEMGALVYKDVKALLNDIDAKVNRWQDVYRQKSALNGILRIACLPATYPVLTECIIKKMELSFPNIKYKIIEVRNNQLLNYLLNNEVDLVLCAFMRQKQPWLKQFAKSNALELAALKNDAYKIAVNRRNALSKKEFLTAEDVKDLALACYTEGDDVAELFFERYFSPKNIAGYNSFEKMIRAALEDKAVSILPQLATEATLKLGFGPENDLKFMTVEDFCVPCTHYLCFTPKIAAMPEFIELRREITEAFNKLPALNCR